MKIILLRDRLGNQMFQYALYKELKYRGQDVKMSLDFIEKHPEIQEYELERVFNIRPKFATEDELAECREKAGSLYGRIREKTMRHKGMQDFAEIQKIYNNDIFIINNIVINGWWQNERYFKNITDKLIEDFVFPDFEDEKNKELKMEIEQTESVGIHVRKTDYLAKGRVDYYGNVCDRGYYYSAIGRLEKERKNRKYYVFTDDINWLNDNLELPSESTVVTNNHGSNSFRDMQLMSMCKTLIIANSTFSWWAGWIGEKHGQRVLCPDRWCNSKNKSVNALCLDRWERISK